MSDKDELKDHRYTEETEHPQTYIQLADGTIVPVDEGIRDLLCVLRDSGVRTEYSCEGGWTYVEPSDNGVESYIESAYFLARGVDVVRLIRKVLRAKKDGRLSKRSLSHIQGFRTGFFNLWMIWLRKLEETGPRSYRVFCERSWHWTHGVETENGYAVMVQLNTLMGFRISLSWPYEKNDEILALLNEAL